MGKTFIIVFHLLTASLNFSFCFLILKYSSRKLFHLFLAGIAFFSGVYSLSYFLSYITLNPFWVRFSHVGYFIPFFFVLFTLSLKETRYLRLKTFLYFLPLPLLFYLALFTNLVLKKINVEIFPHEALIGPLDILGRIYLIVLVSIGILNLIMIYRESEGFKKVQLKYFLLGLIIYCIVGFITAGLIPLMVPRDQSVEFVIELGTVASIFWVGFSSYAVLRYRLMDIRVVLGRSAVYFLSFATVIVLAFLFMFLNNQLVQPFPFNAVSLLILGAFFSLLFFQLIKFYEKIAAEFFYHTFYNTKIVIAELEERLIQVLELETFSSLITATLMNTLKLEKIGILVKEIGKESFLPQRMVGFSEKEILSLTEDEFLPQRLQETKKPILQEELTPLITKVKNEEKEKLQKLQEQMKKTGANLLLPFIFERNLVGIIILGNKISGDAFSSQDVELLTTLSRSASIALKNASLYGEVKHRKEELERFYRLVVGRELKMMELKKKIKELEEELKEKE